MRLLCAQILVPGCSATQSAKEQILNNSTKRDYFWRDRIVPLREIFVKDHAHLLFEMSGSFAPRRIHFVENTDVHAQASFCGRGCHEVSEELDTRKNHPLTRTGQVRKQAVLNRIVLGGVGRIVRDPDFDAQGLRQLLQVLFEQIGVGAVPPAPITQHQQ